ncbi:transmembrane protein 6/97 [Hysterangium stoloniferum]|nr:transmembrane protein 6/97 [Hysterangium stoloniferum]
MARRPLASRPLDLIYFCFFVIHIPASLMIDLHAILPKAIAPQFLTEITKSYIALSGDPLIAGANNFFGSGYVFAWFRSFLWIELLFQLPMFFFGARALWKDSPSIYLPMLIYAASTTTTLLPCLATVLAVPTTEDAKIAYATAAVTDGQRLLLLSSYVPFLAIPLIMTLDMALRLSKLIHGEKRSSMDKQKKKL